MVFIYDEKIKYINILNRIHKKISFEEEGFFIMIRLYLTNNSFYYFICILFRFIPLIIISGDYNNCFERITFINNKHFNLIQFLRKFTCYNLIKQFNITDKNYIELSLFILILFLIRMTIYFNIIKRLKNHEHLNAWPIPGKYQIIIDHLIFLIFPYLLEFLSFSYYIYLFPDKFIIKYNNQNKILLLLVIFINSILIIGYNINNYIFIICSNKIYSSNQFEAFSRTINKKNFKFKSVISYKCSKIVLFSYITLQNLVLFQTIEHYAINNNKIYYKIVMLIILCFIILFLFYKKRNEY